MVIELKIRYVDRKMDEWMDKLIVLVEHQLTLTLDYNFLVSH